MRLKRCFAIVTLLLSPVSASAAGSAAPPDQVIVIGALHALHEREPGFGYDRLGAAIQSFAPDILVLEVRPDELAERKETPGRPEYPAVVWPLLARSDVKAVAMEPGGATFDAISGAAGAAFTAFRSRDPDASAALSQFEAQMNQLLLAHWQTPAEVHDESTATIVAGLQAAQFALVGPAFVAAQREWDDFMAARAVDVVRSNPGKRIMIIGSYKNHRLLETAVGAAAPERIRPALAWFGATEITQSMPGN